MECTFNEKVEELKSSGTKNSRARGQALLLITAHDASVDMSCQRQPESERPSAR